jgi:hypothetical protein
LELSAISFINYELLRCLLSSPGSSNPSVEPFVRAKIKRQPFRQELPWCVSRPGPE